MHLFPYNQAFPTIIMINLKFFMFNWFVFVSVDIMRKSQNCLALIHSTAYYKDIEFLY